MPDREFIHSTADVASTLLYAFDSGFQVRLDEPQLEPEPRMMSREEVANVVRGAFFLIRPEWVFGPLHTMKISGGYNIGKYFVQPGVNYASITLHFQGERIDQGKRRFGSGVLSFDRDWLGLPANNVRLTPPDVQFWFKRILQHLFSKIVIKAGVHRYHVCKGVINDPTVAECLPPFDFIPWDKELLLL